MREVDGRGPETRLTADVLAHFGVADPAGLVRIVYNRDVPRANVATLGPIVQKAHEQGDGVATQILEGAAEELALAARSVASRLEMRGDAFPFVLAGGGFRSCLARRRAAPPAHRDRAAQFRRAARRRTGARAP